MLQVQVRAPGVLVQVASFAQPPLLVAHSLMSVQVTPSPVKPALQAQVREPGVLVQVALAEQPPLLVLHSSMSTQLPETFSSKPGSHVDAVQDFRVTTSRPVPDTVLDRVDHHPRARLLYDPSHLRLQHLDYLGFIDRWHERIAAFHVCDWLVPTRDLLLDRGMMGEGVIDLPAMRAAIEAAGYRGFVEVEIFSNHWWSQPEEAVLDACGRSFRQI